MENLTATLRQLMPTIDSSRVLESVGGGCISQATCVQALLNDGREQRLFVKCNSDDFLENFQAEWDGLIRLRETATVAVPTPLAVGVADGRSWLVLEWIESSRRGRDYFGRFARELATMHRVTLGTQIGLENDNYLGAAKQINRHEDDWANFFAEHRIGFQIRWATDQGYGGRLREDCEQIMNRMDTLLSGRAPETSLLHGDLWSGNYLCGASGEPILIDPAVYYGCREAEFGMLNLFGSCPPEFYEQYQNDFPMNDGWQHRVQIYVLYHLLNHLNLFGGGYHGQCREVAMAVLQS